MVAGAVPKLCGSRSELGAPRNSHCTPASSAWQAGALESWLVCAGRPGAVHGLLCGCTVETQPHILMNGDFLRSCTPNQHRKRLDTKARVSSSFSPHSLISVSALSLITLNTLKIRQCWTFNYTMTLPPWVKSGVICLPTNREHLAMSEESFG